MGDRQDNILNPNKPTVPSNPGKAAPGSSGHEGEVSDLAGYARSKKKPPMTGQKKFLADKLKEDAEEKGEKRPDNEKKE